MQSAEIELKFPFNDREEIEARLPGLGFHLVTPRTFENNVLYDTGDRQLRRNKQILRIRQYGTRCIVTHKRQQQDDHALDPSRFKVRLETETEVGDGTAIGQIFEQLGYAPVFTYQKYRTEWSHPGNTAAHLVLDETPIGNYGELEGPPSWIEETLTRLDVDPRQCLTASYGMLFLQWKQQTGSTANNLTFKEVTGSLGTD